MHPSIFRDLIDCYSMFLAFRHYQHDFHVYFPTKAMLAKFAFLSSLAAQCNHFFTRGVAGKFEKLNQFLSAYCRIHGTWVPQEATLA